MTYIEFNETYGWMVKKYPYTSSFCSKMDERVGTVKTTRYRKHGKRWKETGTRTEELTGRFYCNCVDAVPFFRNIGGYERVSASYTYMGYIPVEITSISPDKTEKVVRKFDIEG